MLKRLILLFVFFALVMTAPSASMAIPVNKTQRVYTAQAQEDGQAQSVMPVQPVIQPNGAVQEYILGVGDRIKMTVFGEAELSGEYEVGSTGIIALPLIGDIPAAGQPTRAFEAAVRAKLSQGYLVDPRVSAQVVNYRPFFILGEVSKPGSYPFVNGMTVVNAVALAGGYTYRADKKDIRMKKASDPNKMELNVKEEESVMPGDVIRVPERFF